MSCYGLLSDRNISPCLSEKEMVIRSEETSLIIVFSVLIKICLYDSLHKGVCVSDTLIQLNPDIVDLRSTCSMSLELKEV